MVPWFPFNPQYTGFISTMMITYNSITQTLHITHQFHHTEAYRDICNHGTLVSFQPSVHWFHFNQNDYIQVYKSIINITHQFHHTEAYRDICNHGTLVSFQPPVHWFHFNQNDYIQVYNSVITHNTSISSNNNKKCSHIFLSNIIT